MKTIPTATTPEAMELNKDFLILRERFKVLIDEGNLEKDSKKRENTISFGNQQLRLVYKRLVAGQDGIRMYPGKNFKDELYLSNWRECFEGAINDCFPDGNYKISSVCAGSMMSLTKM
jgi:hypothetical protein